MIAPPIAIHLPLRAEEHGTIRIADTRVTLESVIADFQRGATPEEIAHHFPVLEISDIYHVIGFGQAIADLILLIEAGEPADFENQVWYKPLH